MRDTSKAALAVGVTGFEPATTWSQTRCATGLRYAPFAPQSYAFFAKCARHSDQGVQGNRIKLWPRQGFHEGNLVKSLHGIDVS